MNNSNEIIGAYIRKLREAKEWSQAELGQRAGLSLQRISSLENGAIPKKKSLLEKVAAALGVSLDTLTTGTVEAEQERGARGLSAAEVRELIYQEVRGPLMLSLKENSTLDVLKSIDGRLEAIQSHLKKFIE